MGFKSHAQYSLALSRRMLEGVLKSFEADSDWLFQPTDESNHALWVIGHLGLADNLFASMFRESTANEPEGYKELFWFGSQPNGDSSNYPPVSEVLAYFRERRENLLEVLCDLSDAELDAPGPPEDGEGPLAGAPSMGQAFNFIPYHEGIHTGQVTVCHRGLGHPPMYQPKNVPAGEGA